MATQGRRLVYESGEWEIDLARRELRARGAPVPIGSRAFDVIEVLVRSAGELVTKHDLTSRVWPGAIVEDVVDAAPAGPLEQRKRPIVGVKYHLLRLPRIGGHCIQLLLTMIQKDESVVPNATIRQAII